MSDFDLSDPQADEFDDDGPWPDDPTPSTGGVEVAGKRIALAGKLGGMNRREAANLLRSFSASVVDLDSPAIDWVVIGAEESPLSEAELLSPELLSAAASGTDRSPASRCG